MATAAKQEKVEEYSQGVEMFVDQDEFAWVEEPPDRVYTSSRRSVYEDAWSILIDHPGKWARIRQFSDEKRSSAPGAASSVKKIAAEMVESDPELREAGAFSIVTRNGGVYACWEQN